MDELAEIKSVLDARLWFIHLPLAERVRLLCEHYVEQQSQIMDLIEERADLHEEIVSLREEIKSM